MNAHGEDDKKDGLVNKLADGILALIQKVSQMINHILDAIKGVGKEHISSDDYMKSDDGKAKFSEDRRRIEKELKDCAREERKVIMMMSDVTKLDPAIVETVADFINKKVASMDWGDVAVTAYRKKVALAAYKDRLPEIQKINARTAELTKQLKANKKNIKDADKKLAALQKLTAAEAAQAKKISDAILTGEDPDQPKKKPHMKLKQTAKLLWRA